MTENNNKEFRLLLYVFSKLTVEFEGTQDVPKEKVVLAIKNILANMALKRIPNAKGVLNTLCDYKEFDIKSKDEFIIFTIKEKGGEKMKKDYSTRMTSGETKVAEAILDFFGDSLKIRKPSRMVFESCLKTGFPKIKNPKAATTNLINKKYIEEKEGKITLGEEGKKYLSL